MSPSDLFRTTSQIVCLSRSGMVAAARKLFDEMPRRDSIAFNAMITSYSHVGLSQEALFLFAHMRRIGLRPDGFTFTATLSACAEGQQLHQGRKLHSLVISFGFQSSLPVCNSLIDMYGKCSSPCCASRVFERMEVRNEVSWCSLLFAYANSGQFHNSSKCFNKMPNQNEIAWNILISSYAQYGESELSVDLYRKMQVTPFRGDLWTFTSVMNACAELSEPSYGCMIHGCIVKSGWSSAVEVANSILSFYSKLGFLEEAVKIFKSIKTPTLVSWNTMIDAHMKVGNVCGALTAFRQAPERNIVSWTTMVCGYARNGQGEQGLCIFVNMIRGLMEPDAFSFGGVLCACASLALLGHGRMIHCCVIRYGFHSDVYVGNGLINMYAKGSDLEGSKRAFDEILYKDLVSWNAMLFGFGLHGQAQEALQTYEDMVRFGLKPDNVTFIGLLTACSHSGLVVRGRELFNLMRSVYGLEQNEYHVLCMIDMLGRGGYLKEASDLVEHYSKKRNLKNNLSEALLGACAVHKDLELGRKVGEQLLTMEPKKEMGYILLSNLYCATGQWKEAERVRKAMAGQGVKKLPGYSWIEVRNMIITFVAGDLSHPLMEDICKILELLGSEMRNPRSIDFPIDL